ncbi:MAG: hypothetical protein HON51_07585 [Gammaproteobacteria bacterium]|jgi:hypothetical protein|nr:hypothetical protein [Gammaproteobacteria bacterium]MBT7435329.1 hypothetical protein [Gammaproteobacteria bacterium]
MSFKKGQSGNPSGRPKQDTANLKKLLAQHGESVLQKVIDAALEGDLTACKLVLDRLYPGIKSQAMPVNIPVGATLPETGNSVVTETMSGNVPPDIGASLITALSNQAKLVEFTELSLRLARIEQQLCARQ